MPTPLEPRAFFEATFAGEGQWHPPPWLRWLWLPRRLRFESSTTWLTDTAWLVHDRLEWSDGRVDRRDGRATLVAPDRVRLTYDGMLGGTELQLRADGFSFAPYTLTVHVPPLPVPLLVHSVDECRMQADGSLLDVLDLSCCGIGVGRIVLRLVRSRSAGAPAGPAALEDA